MIDIKRINSLVENIISNGTLSNPKISANEVINPFVINNNALPFVFELRKYIVSCKSLANVFDSNNLYNLGTHYVNITPDNLITWLVTQSILNGIETSACKLERFITEGYTSAAQILSVSGVTVNEEINIDKNIKLVPIQSLDKSYQSFVNSPKMIAHGYYGGTYTADEKHPKCALIRKIKLDSIVTEKTRDSSNNSINDFSDFMMICSFLTLHKNTTALPFYSWIDIEDHVPCTVGQLKAMKGEGVEIFPRNETLFNQNDWDNLLPLYRKFIALPDKDKTIIINTLSRLRTTRLRWSNVDKAIDLGVALEALFLTSDETYELSYRFKTRAALLLGNSDEEKEKISHLFNGIYACRSQAVHNGELKNTYRITSRGKVNTYIIINEGIDKGIEAIIKIINNGSFYNWKKMELGIVLTD